MALNPGSHRLRPGQGTIEVRTYREGMAQMAGHDLIIDVREWQASAEVGEESALEDFVILWVGLQPSHRAGDCDGFQKGKQ